MSKNLTTKQEAFVQGLIAGKSQRQAYRAAYPSSKKWLDESVDSKASILLKNVRVLSRYNDLLAKRQQEVLKKVTYDMKDAFEELSRIQKSAEDDIRENGFSAGAGNVATGCIKEKAEIAGLHEKKINVEMNGNLNISQQVDRYRKYLQGLDPGDNRDSG